MMDVLPTIVQLGGGHLPADRKIDGMNILPVLTGHAQAGHDVFYFFKGLKLEAVRQGPWKLHLGPKQLYNLESDIGEAKDVSAEHADLVTQLQAVAAKMDGDLGQSGMGPGVRPLGHSAAEAAPLIGRDGKVREGFVGEKPSL